MYWQPQHTEGQLTVLCTNPPIHTALNTTPLLVATPIRFSSYAVGNKK